MQVIASFDTFQNSDNALFISSLFFASMYHHCPSIYFEHNNPVASKDPGPNFSIVGVCRMRKYLFVLGCSLAVCLMESFVPSELKWIP